MQALTTALQAAAGLPHTYLLGPAEVFLLFFIMLGPIKAIGPFAAETRELQPAELRALAWKVFWLATITVVIVALVGGGLLQKWHIPPAVLEMAGGLVFLLVALKLVLVQYEPPAGAPTAGTPAVMHLVFPVTLPPYGIAAIIVLMAMSEDITRSSVVLGMALLVMVLNLLAMLFVRPIMHRIGQVPLQILGAVLGMLQVALALQLILSAARMMGLLPPQG